MDALTKTQKLRREDIAVELLEPNPKNPNKMTPRQFDLLVDNIQQTGLTDPVLVRALPNGRYRIVGGHHRWEGAKYLGFATVPCTIIDDPDFDEELEQFQLVRHNVIKGQMDAEAFVKLYAEVAGKYSDDILQESFGFAEEAEFKKLINATAKSLPKEMQGKFKEAAKELKTIDGLARLLNEMFTKYGDSLPYGYMVFEYGGSESVWLQVEKATLKALYVLGDICRENAVTMDDVVGGVLKAIAKGEFKEKVEAIVKKAPKVEIPAGLQTTPTKDHIAQVTALKDD